MAELSRQARVELEREHAAVQRENLRFGIPSALLLAAVMSVFVPLIPLVFGVAIVVGQTAYWLFIASEPESDDDLLRRLVLINMSGGVVWGLLLLSMLPESVEGQLLLGWLVPAIMIVNLVEAASIRPSFLGFHLPFTAVCVLGYVFLADGTARWLSALIVVVAAHTIPLATSLRRNTWARAELRVSNAQLIDELRAANDELEVRSTHDALTGLLNRAALEAKMAELGGTDEARSPDYSVLFIDLDRFKRINDEHGHHIGDHVIVTVARRIREVTPDDALVCRIGGDEFIVVVPGSDTETEEVEVLADRLVRAIEVPHPALDGERVTASVGVASGRRKDDDPLTAIRNADTAMYRVKAIGGAGWRPTSPQVEEPHPNLMESPRPA